MESYRRPSRSSTVSEREQPITNQPSAQPMSATEMKTFPVPFQPGGGDLGEGSSTERSSTEPNPSPLYLDPNRAKGNRTIPYYSLSPEDLETAAQSDPNAKFIYAHALLNGYQGCKFQYHEGQALMIALAVEAPLTAGGLCARGKLMEHGWNDIEQNMAGAVAKYNAAKEMRYIPGMYLFYSRSDVRFDINKLTELVDTYHYGPASAELANLYYYGNDEKHIEQDIAKATRFAFASAMEHNDLYGRIILGYLMYNNGKRSDYESARQLLAQAKEQVAGTRTFTERRLANSIRNLEFDELPCCLRCLMTDLLGCCCVASFFYPKVVPCRAMALARCTEPESITMSEMLCTVCLYPCLFPLEVAFYMGCVGYCIDTCPTEKDKRNMPYLHSPGTDSW